MTAILRASRARLQNGQGAHEAGYLARLGNASEEHTLEIGHARVLPARELNPSIQIMR